MYRERNLKQSDDRAIYALVELFNTAYSNQVHPQDLLLVEQHASLTLFGDRLIEMAGMVDDGFESMSHINFINNSREKYLTDDENIFKQNQFLGSTPKTFVFEESVHIEKMIYLKIWENYYFLKLLTHLLNLANGIPYEWDLKIKIDNKNKKSDHIRNNIKEKSKKNTPLLHSLISDVYSSQIRNAIAHSQYKFIQGGLSYTNYKKDTYNNIEGLGFEQWEERYTLTLSLFYRLFSSLRVVHNDYVKKTLSNNNTIEIRGSKMYGNKIQKWEYFGTGDRWVWKKN